MKRIGVIIPSITDGLQVELLDGIFKTASAADCDVIVLTTATNGMEFHIQNEIMTGEESIYLLLERAELDGILLVSQYFVKAAVRKTLSELIRRAAIPCIDLGGTELGFETVSIPQAEAVCELTDHIIEKHGCRDLIFLAGPEGISDSEQRISGFLRSAIKHDCSYEIIYGDFWKFRATELGNEFTEHKRRLPDAVLCASDTMAVALCDTLQSGGISVPDDVIVTGYDGHISAISNFPSLTTVSGNMFELGKTGVNKLLGIAADAQKSDMHIIYGASCGCVERMTDYQTAALKVREQIQRDAEIGAMLEMRVNANVITRTSSVDSLDELTDIVDQTAHIIKSYKSLHICILPNWDSDPEHPDACPTQPFPEQMLCALSKNAWTAGVKGGPFPTKHIVPALMGEHEPTLVFVLSLHASSQVFGYCGFTYESALDFTVSLMLFNYMTSLANGMRILRHKLYAEYLQKKIEESSHYDKMTDMLSKKGLLLYLESQKELNVRNCIMLVTVSQLAAAPNRKEKNDLSDIYLQSDLLLANAIRLISGRNKTAAHLDKMTFAIVFSLPDNGTPETMAEEMMIQLEVLIRKMQEGTSANFLPEPYYVCGEAAYPAEKCVSELWDVLNARKPKVKGFTGIGELKKLRRELHKAPELNWNLTELSKRLNISKSYVQKLYKEHFGISYIDDLLEARIEMARQLLLTTDLRISEVASYCGYQNATHFMRQFKDKVGMSPSEFRKSSK
ncbi:helix-turn-helix domain-containing protein [Ruminococcus sp.]|uniref:helix-turn-helix domain-containing protein n=1 Tax=Ruminococcus sp. TaxID=41978 RepID=UPI0025EAF250|nr:helix-turn-helix domain-containing protein [Ruminococcus sp.]MBQ6252655.1 helix-turn-helix domain-containing protein [Ruminococcus sp.]